MQHLESHDGYYHFATKIYCQILHEIGNKRPRNQNHNRNRATNSGTWSDLHNMIQPNAGRAIRQHAEKVATDNAAAEKKAAKKKAVEKAADEKAVAEKKAAEKKIAENEGGDRAEDGAKDGTEDGAKDGGEDGTKDGIQEGADDGDDKVRRLYAMQTMEKGSG